MENAGHAAAALRTARQVPKQEGLLPAATELVSLVTKSIFALAWAGLLCLWFSLFPAPSKKWSPVEKGGSWGVLRGRGGADGWWERGAAGRGGSNSPS